jgi:hypothetical protein
LTSCGKDFFEMTGSAYVGYRGGGIGHKKIYRGEVYPRYICQCRCKLYVAVGLVVL